MGEVDKDLEESTEYEKEIFLEAWKAAKVDTTCLCLKRAIEQKHEIIIFPSTAEILLPILNDYLENSPHCRASSTVVHTHWVTENAGMLSMKFHGEEDTPQEEEGED